MVRVQGLLAPTMKYNYTRLQIREVILWASTIAVTL